MRRTLRAVALAATVTGLLAPAASAEVLLDFDMTARHVVAWSVSDENVGEECESWATGKGTQTTEVRTRRPLRLEAERFRGNLMLSHARAGAFDASLSQRGTWDAHLGGGDTPECSPCGPLSEYGECQPPPKQPTFSFQCGRKPLKGYHSIGIGYQRATAIPDMMLGLTVGAGVGGSTSLFRNCPPTFEGSSYGIRTTRFTRADLPKSFSRDIAALRRGQSASAQASAEVGIGVGKPTDSCKAAKPVENGYTECALSTYRVEVTRVR